MCCLHKHKSSCMVAPVEPFYTNQRHGDNANNSDHNREDMQTISSIVKMANGSEKNKRFDSIMSSATIDESKKRYK